jgi:hypothetical protein
MNLLLKILVLQFVVILFLGACFAGGLTNRIRGGWLYDSADLVS